MAETEKIYVGSFPNANPPTGQTFGSLADSTQFWNYVKDLVDNRYPIGQVWHDAGAAVQKAMDKTKSITDVLNEVLRDLDGKFQGKAGDRFQDKVDDLRRHNVKVFDNLSGYRAPLTTSVTTSRSSVARSSRLSESSSRSRRKRPTSSSRPSGRRMRPPTAPRRRT